MPSPVTQRPGPLRGVRVLDLSRLLPGPYCGLLLADIGADVIKIEEPVGGEYARWMPPLHGKMGAFFASINRNKRSICLNLKSPDGLNLFRSLLKTSDVLLETFRPGVMQRLGLDYDACRQIKPDIIFCSITGYGQSGPYRLRAGHDLNYIGLSGPLALTGRPSSGPIIPGVQIADIAGGALFAFGAIMAALYARDKGEGGKFLDISMTEGAMAFMLPKYGETRASGVPPQRGREHLNGGLPCYNCYRTSDGQYMTLGALEPKFWFAFCDAIGRPDLMNKGHDTGQEGEETKGVLRDIFKTRSRADWIRLFADKDVCCEPVYSIDEAYQSEVFTEREIFFDVQHPVEGTFPQMATPMSQLGDKETYTPPPLLGEHTREVLGELGLSEDYIAELLNNGVIAALS